MLRKIRQRQGRDFPVKDDNEQKKSLLEKLEQLKADTERSTEPVDGHEPPERGPQL